MRTWLQKLRHEKSLSQRELGEAVGLSSRMIQDIEAGKRGPGFQTLFALERTIGPGVLEGFKVEADQSGALGAA